MVNVLVIFIIIGFLMIFIGYPIYSWQQKKFEAMNANEQAAEISRREEKKKRIEENVAKTEKWEKRLTLGVLAFAAIAILYSFLFGS